MQKRIRSSNGTRGAFAKEMAALSPDIAAELAQDRFPSVAVPPIEAGLLPPPRDDSRGSRGSRG
ncbi:conserved hypothetical protein [Burkholderia multivorans CGD2M]|nr:conserved hypothetical protein [Burkholderia multivorans CGD2M]